MRPRGGIVHDETVFRVASTAPRRIGRYELCAKIASGGMASVYFGRIVGSEGFSRVVAIKRVHPNRTRSADFRAMLIDEARLAARINHPNVVQIIELVAEDNELLLVMSYVHGVAVGGLLNPTHGPLSAPVAVRIAIDALRGLHAAHTARDPMGTPLGIVHRDVSPQNLLTSVDGVTLVVDFGVAKAAARLQTSGVGELKGRIRYMPPERIRQGIVAPTTDVYALAVVLWEMLTAHRLFTGSTDPAVLAQVLAGAATRPGALAPGIPGALEDIVMRGLESRSLEAFPVRARDGRGARGAPGRSEPSRGCGGRDCAGARNTRGPRGRHAAHSRECDARGRLAAARGQLDGGRHPERSTPGLDRAAAARVLLAGRCRGPPRHRGRCGGVRRRGPRALEPGEGDRGPGYSPLAERAPCGRDPSRERDVHPVSEGGSL